MNDGGAAGINRSPLFDAPSSGSTFDSLYVRNADNIVWYNASGGPTVCYLETTPVFRDPSAWYHLMFVYDSAQATDTNRQKIYVNGVQITSFGTTIYVAQNTNGRINSAVAHKIGVADAGATYLDGYLTEINFIDGQALTPASFGVTDSVTGVWNPIRYSGTYGNNGFYLNFKDPTSTTTIGYDYSGNSNNWTANNISVTAGTTYDSMVDVPIGYGSDTGVGGELRGNYATLNPVGAATYASLTAANLKLTGGGSGWNNAPSTIAPSSGKWYYEITATAFGTTTYSAASVYQSFVSANLAGSTSGAPGWSVTFATSGSSPYYNAASGTNVAMGSWVAGDICNIAVDINAGKIWFGRNGVWYNTAGTTFTNTDVVAGNGYAFNNLATNTTTYMSGAVYVVAGNIVDANFGQRAFSYTAPSGYKALCTQNLPTATITNGANYMAASLYTGTGASQTVSNAVNSISFQPDWVWIKSISAGTDNKLTDSVRGSTIALVSNSTAAETTDTTGLTAFGASGFTVGASTTYNNSAATYVGWNWKGGGTAVSNTVGTITSSVSANTTAGFSAITYTGNGTSGATIGHGLGATPSLVIVKRRDGGPGYSWYVQHVSVGPTKAMFLDSSNAPATSAAYWNNTAPTSTVFSVGNDTSLNASAGTFVSYCFAPISGFSAFGSYTGNGSTDGPFVYLGFRPRFVMCKRTDTSGNWMIIDSSRSPYNLCVGAVFANVANAQDSTSPYDFVANGYKIRSTTTEANTSGGTYTYMAFAENPFNISRAR